MMPLFVSCFTWDRKAEEWVESGNSINVSNVDWMRVREHSSMSGKNNSFSFDCCWRGDPPCSIALVSGGVTREHTLGLASVLLANAGLPHFPPLPNEPLEAERRPDGMKPPAGSNN